MFKFKSLPVLAGAATLAVLAPQAKADLVDANLFFCNTCTHAPAAPTQLDPSSFAIGVNGNAAFQSPLLVFIAEPGSPADAPVLTLPSTLSAAAAGTYYGLNSATTGTTTGELEGTLTNSTATSTNMASNGYNAAANSADMILSGGSSENFTNWITTPGDSGASSFSIYAVAVSDAATGNPILQTGFDLENFVPGSILFGYACQPQSPAETTSCPNGNVNDTPFTTSGFVPAPPIGQGLPVLLAVGGLLLGFKLWERGQKRSPETAIPHAAA